VGSGWPTAGSTAWRRCVILDAGAGIRSAQVLMPARDADTQPELLKLMRNGPAAARAERHSQEARLNQLLDGQIPHGHPRADPQGEVYRGWCWRCAASITSCCKPVRGAR